MESRYATKKCFQRTRNAPAACTLSSRCDRCCTPGSWSGYLFHHLRTEQQKTSIDYHVKHICFVLYYWHPTLDKYVGKNISRKKLWGIDNHNKYICFALFYWRPLLEKYMYKKMMSICGPACCPWARWGRRSRSPRRSTSCSRRRGLVARPQVVQANHSKQ